MSTALQTIPENGLVLGRYRPLRPLGSGGSGSVWLVRDEESGIDVALKIVGKEGKAASRAEREAHSAARLRHPHCLRAFGFASDARHVYIPYEYVPGHTLRHALRAGELDDAGSVEAAAQVLDALAHAHAHGIVHRDVKPSNVLVAETDEISVRLFDFGLAQLADAETLTAAGDVPGTLAYIPPERLQGQAAGPPADVWAVGVLLWEALAGRHPFWQTSPAEMGRQIQAGAASLGSVRPDLPEPLVAAVDRALAVDPARRPTAAALCRALRGARQERARRSRQPVRLRVSRAAAERAASAAGAGLAVGWISATVPFYPPRWPLLLAAAAAALTAIRPRLGLAFALAIPVFALGNAALGLAVLYAAAAVTWLVLAWPRPRSGLLFAVGALLAPVGAVGLLPLALCRVRGRFRRLAYGVAGVLLTAFSGPGQLEAVAAEESPVRVSAWIWASLAGHSELLLLALVLGAAAAVLPVCARRGEAAIAALGAALAAGGLAAAPSASAAPLVLTAWVTAAALLVAWRRQGGAPFEIHSLGTAWRDTCALFRTRVKPAGGPRWPQALSPQRLGHAARR